MQIFNFKTETYPVKSFAIHAACWAAFISYELGSLYYTYGRLEPISVYVCFYALNIIFFYCHTSLLSYLFTSPAPKYLRGMLYYILLFIVYLSVKFICNLLVESDQISLNAYLYQFKGRTLASTTIRAGYFVLLSTFYWAAGHIAFFRRQAAASEQAELRALKEKAELETKLAASRNAYLTQQVNPHLLFNSLNFIYNIVYRHSPDASKCVMLLADLLRFSLEEAGADGKVQLEEEVAQIRRLLEINNYRFDGRLAAGFHFEGGFEQRRIIPLILFTLTENVFKHGNVRDQKHPAELQLKVDDNGLLHFFSRNLKKSKSGYSQRSGTGLQNVRIRLDFAYPGKYSLDVAETGEYFELSLILQL